MLSNIAEYQANVVRNFDYYDLFDPVLLSYEIGVEKPDPKAYTILLDKLDLMASEIIFIDDTLENFDGARACGIDAIHFVSTEQLIAELKKRSLKIFSFKKNENDLHILVSSKVSYEDYLANYDSRGRIKIYNNPYLDGRWKTFESALWFLEDRDMKVIVEIGTMRWKDPSNSFSGDGGASVIFGDWAKNHNARLYSIDINEKAVEYSSEAMKDFLPFAQVIHGDSVEFLSHFNQPIDFLYLDSWDYDVNNPNPSQSHLLKEVIAAEGKLHMNSVIMIDDCGVKGGGKGKRAIEYLLNRGWIIHRDAHQVILIYEGSLYK